MLASNKQKLTVIVVIALLVTVPKLALAQDQINTDGLADYYQGSKTKEGYWNNPSPLLPASGVAKGANSCVFERVAAVQVGLGHIEPTSERCPDCEFIAALLRGADLNRIVWIYFPGRGYVGPVHVVDAKARHHIVYGSTWVIDVGFNLRIAADAWNPTPVTVFDYEPTELPRLELKPIRRANCFAVWENKANRITYDWVTYEGPGFEYSINGGIGINEVVTIAEVQGDWARLSEGNFWIPTKSLSWIEVQQ